MTAIRVKTDKKTGMFSINYGKAGHSAEARFSLLSMINAHCDLMVLLDATLQNQKKLLLPYPDRNASDQLNQIREQLSSYGYQHIAQMREHNAGMTVMGFQMGAQRAVKDITLMIHVEKGSLQKDFFNQYLSENDYMAGLGTLKSPPILLQEYADRTWTLPTDTNEFQHTLYDSKTLKQFYTGFDIRPYL